MTDGNPFVLTLPPLPDAAVVAIHDFLLDVVTRFENQYFAQMHRYYQDIEQQRRRHQSHSPFDPSPADDSSDVPF